VWVEHKLLLKLFNLLDFSPFLGLLLQPYHDSGPGRPYYSSVAMIEALMLQCFMRIPSERALAEELAGVTGVYAVSSAVRLAGDASRILGVSVWVRSVSKSV
jgi:hypothetical protein